MDKIKKERKISISDQTKNLEKFRRMATVIQDSNDAITFQDLDGNILAWNRGAEIMYGYSEAEALTKNIGNWPAFGGQLRINLCKLTRAMEPVFHLKFPAPLCNSDFLKEI